ncbi:MAG: DUF177 domain-containing protein, partial [Clostridia bacterium]|nr:DUF177 domain-containing protein [Clostridia bacterium]
GRSIEFTEPAVIECSLVLVGEVVEVSGSFMSKVRSVCARCADEFAEDFRFEFDERFSRSQSEGNPDDVYSYSGDVIDLSPMIRDGILLNFPITSVCSPVCRGLCPVCGQNLNITQCSCSPVAERPENGDENPFAGLMELLNDDKEV